MYVDAIGKGRGFIMENTAPNAITNFDEYNLGTTVTIRTFLQDGSSEDVVALFIGKKDDGLYYFYDGMGDGEMIAFSENYLVNNSDKHQIFEGGSEERMRELVAEIMITDAE